MKERKGEVGEATSKRDGKSEGEWTGVNGTKNM